jgi:DNA-binding NtrC family response regulator
MTTKILFVDDDGCMREAMQRALRKSFAVEVASSGPEALDRLATDGPYAVMITDMQMPMMNGIELIQRVEESAPQTVRVMMTGNPNERRAVEAAGSGRIFRLLHKPCGFDLIMQTLHAAVNEYRACTQC